MFSACVELDSRRYVVTSPLWLPLLNPWLCSPCLGERLEGDSFLHTELQKGFAVPSVIGTLASAVLACRPVSTQTGTSFDVCQQGKISTSYPPSSRAWPGDHLGRVNNRDCSICCRFHKQTNQRGSDQEGGDAKPPSQKLLNAVMLGGTKKSLIMWHLVNSYPTDKHLLPCSLTPVSPPQRPVLKALNRILQPLKLTPSSMQQSVSELQNWFQSGRKYS